MSLEKPSIPPCTTILHLIRLWWPSMCHKAFGPGILYEHRCITLIRLMHTLIGSTLIMDNRALSRWTMIPSLLRWPLSKVKPELGYVATISRMIPSSSSSLISEYRWLQVRPNWWHLLHSVDLEIHSMTDVASQVKPMLRRHSICSPLTFIWGRPTFPFVSSSSGATRLLTVWDTEQLICSPSTILPTFEEN